MQANYTSTSPPATLAVDKADRITKLLNSAMKEEKKSKKSQKDSAPEVDRVKELETRLAACLKEYKKYKEECLLLKAERGSYIDEVSCFNISTDTRDVFSFFAIAHRNVFLFCDTSDQHRYI